MDQRPAAALLPDDMLADILARLPPRGLAAARAVCVAWRAASCARTSSRSRWPGSSSNSNATASRSTSPAPRRALASRGRCTTCPPLPAASSRGTASWVNQ
ncbi:unnamed protein product [Urochloa humidicola]